jgi:signal transduction histidine kinase
MIAFSAELLALTAEPALLIKGGKILFANEAACTLLGPDCRSKSFRELFGKEIAGMQAPGFVGETEVAGRRMLLRVKAMEGMRVVFLSPRESVQELISDAFLFTLRTEMMQLGAAASMLKSQFRSLEPGAASALGSISMSLYRLNRTLQNLSIIRDGERDSIVFLPQPLDFVELTRDLIESVRLLVSAPEICFSAPQSLPIQGDPALLETLLLNLLSNCLLHAEGCTRIRVTLHSAGEQVILSVDDDGCGIPGDRLCTVLERYRCECGLSETGHGPGLGLTAAREIARAHGGTLLLESREGIGTAVRVSLSSAARTPGGIRQPTGPYRVDFDHMLTGLADCLPPEAFADTFTE